MSHIWDKGLFFYIYILYSKFGRWQRPLHPPPRINLPAKSQMEENTMKKQKTRMLVIAMLVFTMLLAMTACAAKQQAVEDTASSQPEVTENEATMPED